MSGFSLYGVNISGAEYGSGGTEGTNYTYPTDTEIDYFASKGLTAIRLPFQLERVQPTMDGPLSVTELGYIDNVVNYAASKGIDVILDPHNYGYAYGAQIGSAAVPNSAFANFWGQLAGHFASSSNVLFGLMNEPNDISATQWLGSINAAIGAIRASGATTQQILVPGTYWDTASNWLSSGNAAVIGTGVVDPSHNFAFEVHQYLDTWSSGTQSDVVSVTIGSDRLAAVTAWAEATGNKLFLGEFGVSSDAVSLEALNNMLSFMQQHTDVWEGGTYWAAGAWWGPYMYSVEPTNGVDKTQMAILDQYARASPSNGSASVVQVGNNFYINSVSGGVGPELKYAGAAVVAGQFGIMTPIAVEQTATGYEVAWKVAGANQYEVWTTDNSGNHVSDTGLISATSNVLEALETSFHQDLNGDGVIGFSTTVIETSGSMSLAQVGSNYYLFSGGTGPSLKQGGAAVVVGQFGTMTPIAAEQTATGYEVAWKVTGADQYTVWSTNGSGNYVSTIVSSVPGSNPLLESLETTFHQDLNGDGVIGLPANTKTIESFGSTSLVEVGNNYYLNSNSSGSGPELKYLGAAVAAGQMGAWAPIGMEQTATGYEVAWKATDAAQYLVWYTDSNGNYTSDSGGMSGTSPTLESLETSFHQDLNGDGVNGLAVHAGATLELAAVNSGSVTFVSSTGTLKLDTPWTFNGQIFGFTGDGTLAGSDQIDLSNLNYNNVIQSTSTYNSSTGVLAVNNGTSTVNLTFVGSYSQANFKFASDGHGGAVVYDPPVASGANAATPTTGSSAVSLAEAAQDTFLFKPSFGQAITDRFTLGPDTIQIKPEDFAAVKNMLSAIHEDSLGNSVIMDIAHHTITVQNLTAAQLLAHQTDLV
jgi:aryl-phospho-beta-D-glucosidase BglC (GH1 family)